MCGRNARPDLTWAQLYELQRGFVGEGKPIIRDPSAIDLLMSWNVKPTQLMDITYADGDSYIGTTARWWFVPHWHKGHVKDWKATTFNAKIETAFEKPTFRNAWQSGHCIIPAMGYYEWSGPKNKRQPWYITVEQNAPALFFAGLYSFADNGAPTCTILTRPAEPEIADIHHRMPVILGSDQIEPWLDYKFDTDDAIAQLGCHWTNRFQTTKVHRFGRDDDGPELIEPFEDDMFS